MSKKFRFRYFGWASGILLSSAFITFYSVFLVVTIDQVEVSDKLYLIFAGPFLIVALIGLWMIILTEFNYLEISAECIEFQNIITGRTRILYKKELKGYVTESTKGYLSVNLIGSKNKTVKSIREIYYGDLDELIKLLQLRNLN